jgi:hypothetical protein
MSLCHEREGVRYRYSRSITVLATWLSRREWSLFLSKRYSMMSMRAAKNDKPKARFEAFAYQRQHMKLDRKLGYWNGRRHAV